MSRAFWEGFSRVFGWGRSPGRSEWELSIEEITDTNKAIERDMKNIQSDWEKVAEDLETVRMYFRERDLERKQHATKTQTDR